MCIIDHTLHLSISPLFVPSSTTWFMFFDLNWCWRFVSVGLDTVQKSSTSQEQWNPGVPAAGGTKAPQTLWAALYLCGGRNTFTMIQHHQGNRPVKYWRNYNRFEQICDVKYLLFLIDCFVRGAISCPKVVSWFSGQTLFNTATV